MTTTQIIVIAAVLAIVAVLAAGGWGRGGPRVTTIESRRERNKDHNEDGGSDA